jgi:hypothetical protein
VYKRSNLNPKIVEKREQERNLGSGCLDPNEESPDETQLNTPLKQDEFGDS